jgi:hypothetical protein
MENILEIKGAYNKDCKIFTTDIEESALSLVYSILNTKEYADVPIRIMPDVHTGVGIVIGFSAPITNALNPSFVGVDIGCSITTYILIYLLTKMISLLLSIELRKKFLWEWKLIRPVNLK